MTALMPQSAETIELITGEELALREDLGRGELIEGVFVAMPPPGAEHGRIEAEISFYLTLHARQYDVGEVYTGEAGFYTKRNPDTVRGVDAAFISWDRLEENESPTYLDVAPELVVEVLSPGNRWGDILDKVDEYLSAGVELVWVIDPKRQEVFAYRTLDDVTRYDLEDTLTAEGVLDGFELPLKTLFRKGRRSG